MFKPELKNTKMPLNVIVQGQMSHMHAKHICMLSYVTFSSAFLRFGGGGGQTDSKPDTDTRKHKDKICFASVPGTEINYHLSRIEMFFEERVWPPRLLPRPALNRSKRSFPTITPCLVVAPWRAPEAVEVCHFCG